jgi:hypothetical protein
MAGSLAKPWILMRRSALVFACVLVLPVGAAAQGQIYGQVESAGGTNPAADVLRWAGWLDDTDEEIRIESNTGAGYDGLYWYDDFQNYTTEAAGNPYDYIFVNTENGEAVHLQKAIPSNSFQEENIALSPMTVPPLPAGLAASVISGSRIDLRWDYDPALTYHVYRRDESNNSGFLRLDDPTGDLANPGVSDSVFADETSDGVSVYAYIIIAEDASGYYSAHSDEIIVSASTSACSCPCPGDLDCDGYITAIDLGDLIDVVFANGTDPQDPECPATRSDYDCDGFPTSFDIGAMIDHIFASGPGPCDPCGL